MGRKTATPQEIVELVDDVLAAGEGHFTQTEVALFKALRAVMEDANERQGASYIAVQNALAFFEYAEVS